MHQKAVYYSSRLASLTKPLSESQTSISRKNNYRESYVHITINRFFPVYTDNSGLVCLFFPGNILPLLPSHHQYFRCHPKQTCLPSRYTKVPKPKQTLSGAIYGPGGLKGGTAISLCFVRFPPSNRPSTALFGAIYFLT